MVVAEVVAANVGPSMLAPKPNYADETEEINSNRENFSIDVEGQIS